MQKKRYHLLFQEEAFKEKKINFLTGNLNLKKIKNVLKDRAVILIAPYQYFRY